MALNIRNEETDRLARELAAVTGKNLTDAVTEALKESLLRRRRQAADLTLTDDLLEIGRRCAALPDLDHRSADEILGYDENGLPT